MRTLRNSLIPCILAVFLNISCIRENIEAPDEGLAVNDYLPEFTLTMNDGTEVSSDDLYGKISVLVFFHTSCSDCRQELPEIQKIYTSYATEDNITIIAISREQSYDSIIEYWTQNNLSIPFSAQNDRKIYNLFATSGIPRIYISDDKLKIRFLFTDKSLPTSEQINTVIKQLQNEITATK